MQKKKIIIIISITIIFMLLVTIIVLNNVTNNKKTAKKEEKVIDIETNPEYKAIINKIDKKEDFILYVTSKSKHCLPCSKLNKSMSLFKDIYKIDYNEYTAKYNNDPGLKKLTKRFYLKTNDIKAPCLVFFKEGVINNVRNDMLYEEEIKKVLIDNKYISKENLDIAKDLLGPEEFNKIYKGTEKSIIVMPNNKFKEKKYLYKTAINYKFNFYIMYAMSMASKDGYMELLSKLGDKLSPPIIMVVQGGNILDYLNWKSEIEIENFLKKNGFIK